MDRLELQTGIPFLKHIHTSYIYTDLLIYIDMNWYIHRVRLYTSHYTTINDEKDTFSPVNHKQAFVVSPDLWHLQYLPQDHVPSPDTWHRPPMLLVSVSRLRQSRMTRQTSHHLAWRSGTSQPSNQPASQPLIWPLLSVIFTRERQLQPGRWRGRGPVFGNVCILRHFSSSQSASFASPPIILPRSKLSDT